MFYVGRCLFRRTAHRDTPAVFMEVARGASMLFANEEEAVALSGGWTWMTRSIGCHANSSKSLSHEANTVLELAATASITT